ncbi:tRNA (adenosine(37)-N6)-dimethylallyltransferase MiaA [Hyphococcus flavus]|uniref:tRNA dimethylallyltransferase n=1 Tax=Hyphococcus flavus TaxID=1866326 RepID=A0AAE9ZC86_9PROT|nr:tRNA (adenosine(37)-N6)-dimethylallyltransferase MiaA [Hyphococcus flavus]WDI32059.1 tRNA (adenosine(37)-N6)-dimethylallyltransferase MiaA [Hyphococcus flavus]
MNDAGVIFIAGPTASGKSAAALTLAQQTGGEIVNADAMQVYADLRIVTARPSSGDERLAQHHLYGVLDGAERCSAGRWAQMAVTAITDIHARGGTAIIVGGTGLYFRSLEEGLSPIPDVPIEIREAAKKRREDIGPAAFREEVIANDPVMARLPEGDTQRLVRAWEVFEATGKPLSYYQELPREPFLSNVSSRVVIEPSRETLYARCDQRAAQMLSEGAIEEVKSLIERGLDPSLPVMKALGVPEIAAFFSSEITREEALATLQQSTRRFAKRQLTWFRNQAAGWPRAGNADEIVKQITSDI